MEGSQKVSLPTLITLVCAYGCSVILCIKLIYLYVIALIALWPKWELNHCIVWHENRVCFLIAGSSKWQQMILPMC